MATQCQIDINRRNAVRRTGPRTAAGKARTSRNALERGLAGTPRTRSGLADDSAACQAHFAADISDAASEVCRQAATLQVPMERCQAAGIALQAKMILSDPELELEKKRIQEILIKDLILKDRYRRRAVSSRHRALRDHSANLRRDLARSLI